MILRSTKKLAQKLKIKTLSDTEIKISAFEEWYGHLFVENRAQYILLTNAYSLYSVVFPGRGILNLKSFSEISRFWLAEMLTYEGCSNLIGRFVIQDLEVIDTYKTNNRGIVGSMNDMIACAKYYLSEFQMPLLEISVRLNQTPYSYLDNFNHPLNVIKKLALS